jgi:diguanylate cyclase (GGDEF)-like protein
VSSSGGPDVVSRRGGKRAKGLNTGAIVLDAATGLILSGVLFASNLGLLTNAAAWALVATTIFRVALEIVEGRTKKGAPHVLDGLRAVANGGVAAALGGVVLADTLSGAHAAFTTAAVVSAVGHATLSGERENSQPLWIELQAFCAFGPIAAALALKWDEYTPVALAALLGVFVALSLTARRRARSAEEARGAERQYANALNGMNQCIGMFDASARLISGNSQFIRMFRLSDRGGGEDLDAEMLLRKKLGVRLKDPEAVQFLCDAAKSVAKRQTRMSLPVDLADERCMEFSFQSTPAGFSMLIEDVSARRASEKRIERLAQIDDLTGLFNRSRFRQELERTVCRSDEDSPPFAVMLIDLDRFKRVNDSLGHAVGDKLLQRVAARLREMQDEGDMVARLGGDEFVFLRYCARESAAEFAMRAVETLSEPYHVESAKLLIGASIGIAMAPDDGDDASELMKSADMALYSVKDAGRGAFRFFEKSMAEKARRKQEIESDLRAGILRNELEVFYQPIISIKRRRISCCEALVRWRHPTLGMVFPGEFMGIAEESGLVVQLGEWVLRQACNDAKSWPRDVKLAVNFSAVQFARGNVADMVRRVLYETKFPAARLEMEITESVLMHDANSVLAIIDELREMGMRVALDDFGAGYSSLAYLSRFRPNKVKIDQSFVRDMEKNGTSLAIIKAVKALVQELGIDMLVEGVETSEQFEILRANGADEAQGYLFSKPRQGKDIARLIADPAQLVRGRKLMTEASAPWAKSFERIPPSEARALNQSVM